MKTIQLYLIGSPLYGWGFTLKVSSCYASLALHFVVQPVEDGGVCGKSMSSKIKCETDSPWTDIILHL